jgi:hypothetical protein
MNQLITTDSYKDNWVFCRSHIYNSRLIHFLVRLGFTSSDLFWEDNTLYRDMKSDT